MILLWVYNSCQWWHIRSASLFSFWLFLDLAVMEVGPISESIIFLFSLSNHQIAVRKYIYFVCNLSLNKIFRRNPLSCAILISNFPNWFHSQLILTIYVQISLQPGPILVMLKQTLLFNKEKLHSLIVMFSIWPTKR